MSSALLYTYFLVILREVFCIVNKASAHNKLVIVDGSTAFPLLEAQFVLFPIRSSTLAALLPPASTLRVNTEARR